MKIDKVTEGKLLQQYPEIDWKGVKGIRDIISHHYFEINAEIVYSVCRKHISGIKSAIQSMIEKQQIERNYNTGL